MEEHNDLVRNSTHRHLLHRDLCWDLDTMDLTASEWEAIGLITGVVTFGLIVLFGMIHTLRKG